MNYERFITELEKVNFELISSLEESTEDSSFYQLIRARLYFEKAEFNESETLLIKLKNTDNNSNEVQYLLNCIQILKGTPHTTYLEEQFRLNAANSARFCYGHASALFSWGKINDSLHVLNSITDQTGHIGILKNYLELLIQFEYKNRIDDCDIDSLRSKIFSSGLLFYCPLVDYLKAKVLLIEDSPHCKFFCETKIREYQHPFFKRSLLPFKRMLDALGAQKKLESTPMLEAIYNDLCEKPFLTKEDIFTILYPKEMYNPLIHDARIYNNLRRLKHEGYKKNFKILKNISGWSLEKTTGANK